MKIPHTSRTISYARWAKAEVLIFTIKNFIFFPFELFCDAPKPGGPLTTRQPAECKWRSGYPTPL